MESKEKAIELYNEHKVIFKHYDANPKINTDLSEYFKKCALKTVYEIVKSLKCCDECSEDASIEMSYWNDVKREIQNL